MLEFEILSRLAAAFLLGALIGLEREVHGRPAGLRTHILVGFGSALITIVSIYGMRNLGTSYDPGRIAAQVVSGIGFLGAGTILREGLTIKGLTTAASLWMVAAIGLAAGSGMVVIASISTGVALIVLYLLHGIESRLEMGGQAYELEVNIFSSLHEIPEVMEVVKKYRGKVSIVELAEGRATLHLILKIPNFSDTEEVLREITLLGS